MGEPGRTRGLQVCKQGPQQGDAHSLCLLALSQQPKQLAQDCMALRRQPQRCTTQGPLSSRR
jgi:hypothetical protein